MLKVISGILILFFSFAGAKEYIYLVKEKGIQYYQHITITDTAEGALVEFVTDKEDTRIIAEMKYNKDQEPVEWHYSNNKSNIDVKAVKEGDKLFITGSFNGKTVNRSEHTIDKRPWQSRCSTAMLLATKARGLLISWATPADSIPIEASFSFWTRNE